MVRSTTLTLLALAMVAMVATADFVSDYEFEEWDYEGNDGGADYAHALLHRETSTHHKKTHQEPSKSHNPFHHHRRSGQGSGGNSGAISGGSSGGGSGGGSLSGECASKPEYADAFHNVTSMIQQLPGSGIDKDKMATRLNSANDMKTKIIATTSSCGDIKAVRHELAQVAKDFADDLGQTNNATEWYRNAVLLRDGDYERAVCDLVKTQRAICEWDGLEKNYQSLHRVLDAQIKRGRSDCMGPFTLSEMPDDAVTPQQLLEVSKQFSVKGNSHEFKYKEWKEGEERLRVGFVSYDFRAHPLGDLVRSLFHLLDRGKVEAFCYSTSPPDTSESRAKIKENCEHFYNITSDSVNDNAAAKMINEHGIHVLFDLNGYTKGKRQEIFALNPAEVQANWLGWAGPTGSPFMMYQLLDKQSMPPELASFYSENLVYMPHTYFLTDHKQSFPADELAKEKTTRASLGLPEDKLIFANFNNLYKTDPVFLDAVIDILKKVENSVMWLLEVPPAGVANIKHEVAKRGGDPDRFIFTARFPKTAAYYRGMANADLYLDTFTVNGHTVVTDTLWAGVPCVTMPGKKLFARVASALLKAVNLPELVTSTKEQYINLAVELANNKDKLKQVRDKLAKEKMTAPLYDTHRWVKNFEVACVEMYKHRKNPGSIEIRDTADASGGAASTVVESGGSQGNSEEGSDQQSSPRTQSPQSHGGQASHPISQAQSHHHHHHRRNKKHRFSMLRQQ